MMPYVKREPHISTRLPSYIAPTLSDIKDAHPELTPTERRERLDEIKATAPAREPRSAPRKAVKPPARKLPAKAKKKPKRTG